MYNIKMILTMWTENGTKEKKEWTARGVTSMYESSGAAKRMGGISVEI